MPDSREGLRFRLWAEDGWLCYQLQDGDSVRLRGLLPFSRRLRSDCHLALAQLSQSYVFVHAGVVRFEQGGLLMLPGESRAGKSTLTHALTEHGYSYYSDEYALIRADGRVLAFPRALSLRVGPVQRVFLPAPQLGWRESLGPERVHLFLDTRYQPEAHWRPEPMSSSELLIRLLANSVTAATRPSQTIAHLHALIQGGRGWRGVRGESVEVVQWLQNQVARDTGLRSSSVNPGLPL